MMKKILLLLTALYCVSLHSQEYADNSIFLQLKNNLPKQVQNLSEFEELEFLFEENDIKKIKTLDIQRTDNINGRPLVVVFKQPVDIERLFKRLKQTNLFQYVEFDYIAHSSGQLIPTGQNENYNSSSVSVALGEFTPLSVTPNDQYFFRQWGFHNDGTFPLSHAVSGADVKMKDAWEITTGSEYIVMAIIDSGLKMDHPEFVGRFWINQNESLNGWDDDGNGYVDDINGWDFVNDDNDPTDGHSHGTRVTGIAAATGNNGIGYAGVDWNCKILPLKVINTMGSVRYSDAVAAIYYAVSRSANVINMSLGGSGYSSIFHNAVIAAYNENITTVACMMNENRNSIQYPAAFPEVIAVGSTDPNDYRSAPFMGGRGGSNYGDHIDVVAPGNYIYLLSQNSDTDYERLGAGTSFAAPLVAGIVTLMLSIEPSLTVEQIRNILRSTAQDQVGRPREDTAGFDRYHGAGRVNAYQALLAVQNLSVGKFDDINISVYPNPTDDILHIQSKSDIKCIKIYDTTGRFIRNYENVSKIDMTTFNSGIYLLDVLTDDKNTVLKVVKK